MMMLKPHRFSRAVSDVGDPEPAKEGIRGPRAPLLTKGTMMANSADFVVRFGSEVKKVTKIAIVLKQFLKKIFFVGYKYELRRNSTIVTDARRNNFSPKEYKWRAV